MLLREAWILCGIAMAIAGIVMIPGQYFVPALLVYLGGLAIGYNLKKKKS